MDAVRPFFMLGAVAHIPLEVSFLDPGSSPADTGLYTKTYTNQGRRLGRGHLERGQFERGSHSCDRRAQGGRQCA
jgi:hypothetical protein